MKEAGLSGEAMAAPRELIKPNLAKGSTSPFVLVAGVWWQLGGERRPEGSEGGCH